MEAFQGVIFSSHDEQFRSPQGAIVKGSELTLRILVSKALAPYGVTLRLWDNGIERLLAMRHTNSFAHTPYGDFLEEFTVNVSCETSGQLWYYFIVYTAQRPLYCINNPHLTGGKGHITEYRDDTRSFRITVTEAPLTVPQWAKGAIMYQIFPDRFMRDTASGDLSGRRVHENWLDEPEYKVDEALGYYPANDFFGGNFKGITQKLDHLKALNVDVLYLNPIFSAYSNHRYDTADYETVDRALGTEADLDELICEADKRGIRIILDGVFSHTGSDSRYFNREGRFNELGAYESKESPYYDWYDFESFPDKYDCWWGVWSLPCVKELTPSYVDYILTGKNSIVKKWLKKGISGWRLDVADELPDEFLKILRTEVKSTDPDALILGEVWEDASNKISYGKEREFLLGNELDSVMNYPLKNAVVDYLIGKTGPDALCNTVLSLRENYPPESFACLMNFLSTHDSERILTRLIRDAENMSREEQAEFVPEEESKIIAKALSKLASLIIFTLPGMPSVYYGDEAGLEGMKDPFNRKPYPWGREDGELMDWYKTVSSLRDEVLRHGKLYIDTAGELLSIRRCLNGEWRYALFNATDESMETLLDISYFRNEPQILCDTGGGVQLTPRENGWYLLLPPRSALLLK